MTPSEKAKDSRLRKIYKKTLAEQNELLKEQEHACAICQRPFPKYSMFQDHEHKCCPRRLKTFCGKCNRGLLCFLCNKFLVGVVEKQNLPVDRLLAYMTKWKAILTEKGCYEPKPKKSPKLRSK